MRRLFLALLFLLAFSSCASPQPLGGPAPAPTALSGDQFCKRFDFDSVNRISSTHFVAVRTEAAPEVTRGNVNYGGTSFGCFFVGPGVDVTNADAVLLAQNLSILVTYAVSRAAADKLYGDLIALVLKSPTTPPCASDPNGSWHRSLTLDGQSAIEEFSCQAMDDRPAGSAFALLIRKDTIWIEVSYKGPGDLEAAGRYVLARVP